MKFWGVVLGHLPALAAVWAVIKGTLFVKCVFLDKDGFDEAVRKRTKILFPLSVLSVVVAFLVCFLFSKISVAVEFFLICYLIFFAMLPYGLFVYVAAELIILIMRVFIRRDKYNDDQRRTSKILFYVSLISFGTSIIIMKLYGNIFS